MKTHDRVNVIHAWAVLRDDGHLRIARNRKAARKIRALLALKGPCRILRNVTIRGVVTK